MSADRTLPPAAPRLVPASDITHAVLAFDDNRIVGELFGQFDQNLALLEARLGVEAVARGNQVTIKGPHDACEQARHVLEMTEDLAQVIAMELYTAAQALDYRRDMINAARRLAERGDLDALCAKVVNAPRADHPDFALFRSECAELLRQLSAGEAFSPSAKVEQALQTIRKRIPFMARDRSMDGDIRAIGELVESNALLG